jgi:transcriptional antiterminator RfaH
MTGLQADPGTAAPRDAVDWYLVHARPRQEGVAAEHLERQGYAAYLPRLRLPRLRRSRWHEAIEPLFPRYLFAGVRAAEQSLHPIRSTRGVSTLVRSGERYRPVPRDMLASLQARADDEGLHRLHRDEFAPGARVRILAGPFAGLEAAFESRQGQDRVRVLLEIIGAATAATLPASLVVPALRDRWMAA